MDCRNRFAGRREPALIAAAFLLFCWQAAAQSEQDRPRERGEWNTQFRRDLSGKILSENRQRALRDAGRLPVDPAMRSPGTGLRSLDVPMASWQTLGPQPIQSKVLSDRNWGNVAGRVDALAIHPSNSSVLLLGSATGGIWKSTDSGSSWRPVSDNAPSLATSSIAFAPSNPSIVYATTGELDEAALEGTPSRSLGTYLGAGLLKSLDGGESWFRVDANLPANAVFARVLVDPRTPQNVIVGVNIYDDIAGNGTFVGGIYRSTDGGVNFSRLFGHLVTDLAQDPNDPSRLYMAASDADCSSCPAGGIYVSADSGVTWRPILTPSSAIGNVRIGVTRTNPATVYASVVDGGNVHSSSTGIFVSADAGGTWQRRAPDPTMCPSTGTNQCDYDHWITPSPNNPNVVYFGSINIYKSVDGAQTWAKLTDQYVNGRPEPVHPDQHACTIVPGSPNTIYFANDGGVYRTTDGGATFQNLNATLSLSQFNGVALHPSNPSFAIGGTQDNGNVRYTGSSLWTDVTSGDGGFDLIRRDNPAEVMAGNYDAFMKYSSDGGVSFSNATPCGTLMDCDKDSPLEPMSFYPPAATPPSAPGTILFGTNRIWANTTFGRDPSAWAPRSSGKITNTHFTAVAAAGDGSGAVWGGTVTGSVFFSSDGGATFSPRFTGLPAAVVTRIVPFSADGRSAYVTFGGFLGSPSRHVFYTMDAGVTWTNLSSNLPDVPVLSLAVNPTDANDLFVGTDAGVFRNPAGSSDWFAFNQGLPAAAPVYALAFSPASGELHAATYGRGVFKISLGGAGACVAASDTLCLNGSRFHVQVRWRVPSQGTSGSGVAVPMTGDTGYFWFFSANNIELVVKVVDGKAFNNRFWVFYGALSDVEYTITITDTATGAAKTYFNPSGQLASVADTDAFPSSSVSTSSEISASGPASGEVTMLSASPRHEARRTEPPLSSTAGPVRTSAGAAAQPTGFSVLAVRSQPVRRDARDLAGLALARNAGSAALPNLTTYQPTGWSDRIVVAKTSGTRLDSNPLLPSDSLYLSWAVLNSGDAPTSVRFYVELYVDGLLRATWYADPPLNPNFYVAVGDFALGTLSGGTHILRIKADSTGVIAESNETDNEYTKTIVVSAPPNLTTYQPTGWSDRIVVARAPGTKIESGSLSSTDSLYVSWAAINNGSGAVTARFYAELYVDGALRETWYSDPPLNPNYYVYIEDFSIGPLSAGTHTLRIKLDSTGAIAESNESDNEYTKTITISAGSSCAAGPTTLCLNGGRFRVQISWRVPSQGTSGAGQAVGVTGDTGYFWFFSSSNIELVVKVVDGRAFNGRFWVFYGALSNVEYTITVTDTATGAVRTYFNPSGQLASVADTSAF